MINNYSLSSAEINDKIYLAYENLIYLIGVKTDNGIINSGIYDQLEYSGVTMMGNLTGIPHVGSNEEVLGLSADKTSDQILRCLKYDYVFKTYYNF